MSGRDDQPMMDDQAGRLVRPYLVSGGRTETLDLDLVTLIRSTRTCPIGSVGPDHGSVLMLCRDMVAVAEVAAHMRLPVGVVKVLISDLLTMHAVQSFSPQQPGETDTQILEAILEGLKKRL